MTTTPMDRPTTTTPTTTTPMRDIDQGILDQFWPEQYCNLTESCGSLKKKTHKKESIRYSNLIVCRREYSVSANQLKK